MHGWLINRNVSLIVLEAGRTGSRCQHGQVQLVEGWPLCLHMAGGAGELSGVLHQDTHPLPEDSALVTHAPPRGTPPGVGTWLIGFNLNLGEIGPGAVGQTELGGDPWPSQALSASSEPLLIHPVPGNTPSVVGDWCGWALFQAGHNFHNVDLSYVKRLCGTKLGGPKLPQR